MPRWLTLAAKAAVTAGLVGWLVERVRLAPLAQSYERLDAGLVAAALVLMFAQLALAAWRWAIVARTIDAPLPAAGVARLVAIGQFFNQTLPSAIGGDAVRAWLATRYGLSFARAAVSVIVDRLAALLTLILLIGAMLPAFYARVDQRAVRLVLTLLVLGATFGFLLIVLFGPYLERKIALWRDARPFVGVSTALARVLTAAASAPLVFALSLGVHVLVAAVVLVLAWSLRLDVGLVDCLVIVPPVVLVTMVPVSIAGWGVREGAMVVGFGLIGVAPADALALSIAFGLLQIAAGLPGGLIWLVERPARAGRPPG